uniref:Basic form of pathogenesis-related protein 1-like n=1 Tax=Elaeis guineensis var. tenera TaxID=51953 RepID=A0A6I9SAS4_ELAGV|nr:basic form of pathogenesis-related protein 1-like [Elaeis guineensis]
MGMRVTMEMTWVRMQTAVLVPSTVATVTVTEVGEGSRRRQPLGRAMIVYCYIMNKYYANLRAGDCQLVHSQGPYGENIYTGYGQGYSDGVDAVRYWYNEKPSYDYVLNQGLGGVECLHYTQMVWRNSKRIGCARVECSGFGGQYSVTYNYDPPGNILGERPY